MERTVIGEEIPTFESRTAEYMARVEHWDYILRNGQTSSENWQNIIPTIQDELQECPYEGVHLFVRGTGLIPDVSALVAEKESFEILGETQGMTGMHEGIIVMSETDDQGITQYRLRHKLHVAVGTHYVSIVQKTTNEFYAYLDIDAELVPTGTLRGMSVRSEADFLLDEKQSVLAELDVYSQKSVNEVRSTRFRRLTRDKQAQVISGQVNNINESLQIRGLGIEALAEYIIAPVLSNGQLYLVPIEVDPALVIEGECLGVGSLDELLIKNKAIRRDSDMFSKFVGLSILLDPDPKTRDELRISDDQIVYLPFGNQQISLEFS